MDKNDEFKNEAHKARLKELIFNQSNILSDAQVEALLQLHEEAPPSNGKPGPRKPAYSDERHKNVAYLSGTNVILLTTLVALAAEHAKQNNKPAKKTKSVFINTIIEEWFATNPDIEKIITS